MVDFYIPDPNFSLCWDNIQKNIKPRNSTTDRTDHFLIWANAYAVKNRITAPDMSPEGTPTKRALHIPLTDILPSPEDVAALRMRLVIIATRILVQCVPFFSSWGSSVLGHIPHDHSDEMTYRSEIVRYN